jgi:hypothetical protein
MISAPFVFYCHPYELDPLEFKEISMKIPLHVRLHQGAGRRWFLQRFKAFLNRFGGQPVENLFLAKPWPKIDIGSFHNQPAEESLPLRSPGNLPS